VRRPFFQVDAFTTRRFAGNPAAVVPLEAWPGDPLLQAVAAENNLSETAFLVRRGGDYDLRWFTPKVEVKLCGHATLATAHVLFTRLEPGRAAVTFHTKSGPLLVRGEGGRITMDFPADPPRPAPAPPGLVEAVGGAPEEVLRTGWAWVLRYPSEAAVRALAPDFRGLLAVTPATAIATAPGSGGTDFVSRFFGPGVGVDEDPVTGSAHCVLAPYWAGRLGRADLRARQVSARGGEVGCEVLGERVHLSGRAVSVIEGTLEMGD
jgi:PhzF family phenazine biosynthesis protein